MGGKKRSVADLQLATQFEELRNTLLQESYAPYRAKPLACWILPTDRRLPLVFLARSLDDLLDTPFDALASTPGVGKKKIRAFLDLLARALSSEPPKSNGNGLAAARRGLRVAESSPRDGFDPDQVSEMVWDCWRESACRCGLGRERLGRVAPTLQNVTRVIWNVPLEEYLRLSIADLREKKTFGKKRVQAILEVVYGLHRIVAGLDSHEQLVVRLVPRRIDRVECWVGECLQSPETPTERAIFENLIEPLVGQLRCDASDQLVHLAEILLGIGGPRTSVRQAARQMGLTRARVYQLLNEINDILKVRWPLGRGQIHQLLNKLQADGAEGNLDQFRAAVEVFYPSARRGAAGPVEGCPDQSYSAPRSTVDS